MVIRILDKGVSSLIAAGEVIERPVSIVKELIENSLDAHASRIDLNIEKGGIQLIQVVDNGVGIPSSQIELAFHRFATSKLKTLAELEQITTLGFRGEALASIAAVSHTVMISRPESQKAASRIELENGQILDYAEQGFRTGTSVTVSNLFKNFPARKKFLSSGGAEASRIVNLCSRYALAHPRVSWNLNLSGKSKFTTPGNGSLVDAVSGVYGAELVSEMMKLELSRSDDLTVSGLISSPKLHRSNRSSINIFVNGRWIHSPYLNQAVVQGYHGFLKERRFPICVINIKLTPSEIDVNVHPAKTEVRFAHPGEVFNAVQHAIREALMSGSTIPIFRSSDTENTATNSMEKTGAFWTSNLHPNRSPSSSASELIIQDLPTGTDKDLSHIRVLPLLRVLGQAQNTYILAEGPDGIYVLDQHAAHERILYESVLSENNELASQALLDSAVIELEPRLIDSIDTLKPLLNDMGFVFEPFGHASYVLRAVPAIFQAIDPREGFMDVIKTASNEYIDNQRESAAKTIACHAAIRAGKKLSNTEMEELIRLLENCNQPQTCPHGRPTVIHLATNYLETQFGRR